MMNRGINHIGLTVPSIEEATAFLNRDSMEKLHMIVKLKKMNQEVANMSSIS